MPSNGAAFLKGYKAYLQLERSMASLTVEAYLREAGMALDFLATELPNVPLEGIRLEHLQSFVAFINDLGMAASSQARILSGIKSFFRYQLLEGIIAADPTELLAAPKTGRALPEVLSTGEIDA